MICFRHVPIKIFNDSSLSFAIGCHFLALSSDISTIVSHSLRNSENLDTINEDIIMLSDNDLR